MRIQCAISGLTFNCEHFPAELNNRESIHPIFNIPQKQLFQYIRKYVSHELTDTDSYLYYLALLQSTGLFQWNVPARFTPETKRIIHNNMELLLRTISKINLVLHPAFVLHKVAINKDNCDLASSSQWIHNWLDSYESFSNGYKREIQHDRLMQREARLDKMIRNQNVPIEVYARQLADWAADAGEFPQYKVNVDNKQLTQSDYWKRIIIACTTDDRIFAINEADLDELIEYCEDNVDAGSNYGHALFSLLRSGKKKQAGYLGFDDLDIASSSFTIISPDATIQEADRIARIHSAPKIAPEQKDYPNKLAWLLARARYDEAQQYWKQKETSDAIIKHVEDTTPQISNDELNDNKLMENPDDSDFES